MWHRPFKSQSTEQSAHEKLGRGKIQKSPEVGQKSVRSRPEVARGWPEVGPKSGRRRAEVGPKSARSRPEVGTKSARSRPEVSPKSAPSRPQVGPKSAPRGMIEPTLSIINFLSFCVEDVYFLDFTLHKFLFCKIFDFQPPRFQKKKDIRNKLFSKICVDIKLTSPCHNICLLILSNPFLKEVCFALQ